MSNWLKRYGPTILSVLGAIGTVVTAVLVAKETPTVVKALEEAEDAMEEEPTLLQEVKVAAPIYAPAVIAGVSTVACILGANVLSNRQQASLIAAYAVLEGTFKQYKDKVIGIFGPQGEQIIEKAIQEENAAKDEAEIVPFDEKQTFYEEHCGKFFEVPMKTVMMAEYMLNRTMSTDGFVRLNEFYDYLGLDHIPEGDDVGWDVCDGEAFYGYGWIDFEHRYYTTDDGLRVCSIDMPFGPHPLMGEEGYGQFCVDQ